MKLNPTEAFLTVREIIIRMTEVELKLANSVQFSDHWIQNHKRLDELERLLKEAKS